VEKKKAETPGDIRMKDAPWCGYRVRRKVLDGLQKGVNSPTIGVSASPTSENAGDGKNVKRDARSGGLEKKYLSLETTGRGQEA